MKKKVDDEIDYVLNNPYIEKENYKEKVMIILYTLYKNVRMKISSIIPLKSNQEYMWLMDHHIRAFSKDNSVERGFDAVNRQEEQAYYILKQINIFELIAKEQLKFIKPSILKFYQKHGSNINITNNDIGQLFNKSLGFGKYVRLCGMTIKSNSKLYKYIKRIEFELNDITNTFCCLNINLYISGKLANKIDKFATKHHNSRDLLVVPEYLKWYEFKNLTIGEKPGASCKQEIIDMIIRDIKWNVTKELVKYFPIMILQVHKIEAPSISIYCTNIESYKHKEFWNSVGIIHPYLVDFAEGYNSCLYLGSLGGDNKFLYRPVKMDLLYTSVNQYIYSYLIGDAINRYIRDVLTEYSWKINELTERNIGKWINEKIKLDTQLYFFKRFLDEYKVNLMHMNPFERIGNKEQTNLESACSYLSDLLEDTREIYESIMKIYQSNVEYRNVKENFRLQKRSLFIAIISTIIAVLALYVTINDIKLDKNTSGQYISCFYDMMLAN